MQTQHPYSIPHDYMTTQIDKHFLWGQAEKVSHRSLGLVLVSFYNDPFPLIWMSVIRFNQKNWPTWFWSLKMCGVSHTRSILSLRTNLASRLPRYLVTHVCHLTTFSWNLINKNVKSTSWWVMGVLSFLIICIILSCLASSALLSSLYKSADPAQLLFPPFLFFSALEIENNSKRNS